MNNNPLSMTFVKEVLNLLIKSKEWEDGAKCVEVIGCQEKQVQSALNVLYKGGYVLRKQVEDGKKVKKWKYRLNQHLPSELIEELAHAALTCDDFLEMSPIPLEERQSFRYQYLSESLSLKEAVDLAKQNGDLQVENLENLAKASHLAFWEYIETNKKKDKKLQALHDMMRKCEQSFWEYAKKLPTV